MAKLIKDEKQNFIMTFKKSEFDKLPIKTIRILDDLDGVNRFRDAYQLEIIDNENPKLSYTYIMWVNQNDKNQFEVNLGRFTHIRHKKLLDKIPLLYDLYKQYKLNKKQTKQKSQTKSKSNNFEMGM